MQHRFLERAPCTARVSADGGSGAVRELIGNFLREGHHSTPLVEPSEVSSSVPFRSLVKNMVISDDPFLM